MKTPLAVRVAAILTMALALGGCVSKSIKSTSVPSGAAVKTSMKNFRSLRT